MTGTILGNRYELLQKIGEGGMAEVYKAKCRLLNRYVAVKVLKSQYSDNADFLNKFRQEASSAASLSHSNIVAIYDIGSEKDINYIVMEYIDGKTLKQVINEQKILKYEDVIDISIQIAKALECAHNNNIIHRDVKPHNILVTKDGIIKVTDFGIAKATSSVTITNSDRILGSAHYFSPEQAKGNYVDCKTDIYSLGIIMYEMVTGKLPYDGESPVAVALKHIQEKAKEPIEINNKIPKSLNKLILKAIEKEQYKRYQSASDLLVDLNKLKVNPNLDIVSSNNDENEFTKVMKPITDYTDKKDSGVNNNLDDDFEDRDDNLDSELEKESSEKVNKKNDKNKVINKKMIIGSMVAVLILIIGFVGAFSVFNNKLGKNKGMVKIPNIIGLTKENAEKLLSDKGLKFTTSTEASDKPAGIVIKCYPDPNTEVSLDDIDEVKAIISSGPKMSTMPNLMDIELDNAREYLKNYNLNIGSITYEYSTSIEKGRVCNQSPRANEQIGENTIVNLVISNGVKKDIVSMPNLINKNIDEAKVLLNTSGLILGDVTKISTDKKILNNLVSSQSIESGKEVSKGTCINLSCFTCDDKNNVVVPNFVGKTVREARKLANSYKLKISCDGQLDFIIVSQNKLPGKEVVEGTCISLKSEPNP